MKNNDVTTKSTVEDNTKSTIKKKSKRRKIRIVLYIFLILSALTFIFLESNNIEANNTITDDANDLVDEVLMVFENSSDNDNTIGVSWEYSPRKRKEITLTVEADKLTELEQNDIITIADNFNAEHKGIVNYSVNLVFVIDESSFEYSANDISEEVTTIPTPTIGELE